MKKRSRAIASSTVLSLILTSTITTTNVNAAANVIRVPGTDREATSMEVAKEVFGTAETVILVNGYGYPDAVSATPLAKALNAPILLTNNVDYPSYKLTSTLSKLGTKRIVIVGGTGVVSSELQRQLNKNYNVERIGGDSRYETNANVAKRVLNLTGKKSAILVSAEGYADALSVASIAATKGIPVLFGNSTGVPYEVKNVARGLDVLAVGGSGVLPQYVLNSVGATRVAQGASRFETNLSVLKYFKNDLKLDNIYVAAGGYDKTDFADALVASAAAAKVGAPVVLSGLGANSTAIDKANTYINNNIGENTKVTVIGGRGSVSESIVDDLEYIVYKSQGGAAGGGSSSGGSSGGSGNTDWDNVNVSSVQLNDKVYDDNTSDQQLSFSISGGRSDIEYLRQAGYNVNFIAIDDNNNLATGFFDGNSGTSTTGLLNDNIKIGDYTVEMQVMKDGKVIVSNERVISIKDLDTATSSISKVEISNVVGAAEFIQNSTTLVVGETAKITKLEGNAGGKSNIELPVGSAKLTSSNPAIISVDNQAITANAAGNATITIKIGNATRTINLTVKSETRKVSKITPAQSTVKLVKGETLTIEMEAKDQYGDPIKINTATLAEDLPQDSQSQKLVSIKNNATSDAELLTNVDGKTTSGFDITGLNKGSGTLLFKDDDKKVVGQIYITVTEINNVNSTKVEYTVASADTTNEFEVGEDREYQVSKYNTQGEYNGKLDLVNAKATDKFTVEAADPSIVTVQVNAASDTFKVIGVKEGKTDIMVKDHNGLIKHKFTVTITAEDTSTKNVKFKSISNINYAGEIIDVTDILDVRQDSTNDPIVYGVEHNVKTIDKVRIDQTTPDKLVLYIDNTTKAGAVIGHNDSTDIVLGVVTAEVLTGAKGSTAFTALDGKTFDINVGSIVLTTASTDKGTILFRVIVDKDDDGVYANSEAVATKVVTIDIK